MGGFGDGLGPLLIGPLITTFLYGISSLQTYIYFTKHATDRREMKLWVSFIWVVDTVQVILVSYGIYFWVYGHTLEHPDNALSDKGKRSMEASSGMNLLIGFSVQCFFVKRIFQLSRDRYRWWLFSALAVLTVTHLALGSEAIVKVIHALKLHSTTSLRSLTISAVMPYTIAAVLADLCIAVTLINLLRTRRSDLENFDSVVDRAVNYILTRCVLVTIAAVIRLITFAALPNATWFIAVDFMMGKIYSNSLLAMLNSRQPTSRVSQDTPLESGQFFTTVLAVPEVGPESTVDSGRTTSVRTTAHHRTVPVESDMNIDGEDKEPHDMHNVTPFTHQ